MSSNVKTKNGRLITANYLQIYIYYFNLRLGKVTSMKVCNYPLFKLICSKNNKGMIEELFPAPVSKNINLFFSSPYRNMLYTIDF